VLWGCEWRAWHHQLSCFPAYNHVLSMLGQCATVLRLPVARTAQLHAILRTFVTWAAYDCIVWCCLSLKVASGHPSWVGVSPHRLSLTLLWLFVLPSTALLSWGLSRQAEIYRALLSSRAVVFGCGAELSCLAVCFSFSLSKDGLPAVNTPARG
jgi:hypothetical protein